MSLSKIFLFIKKKKNQINGNPKLEKKLSHTLSMFIMLGELRIKVDTMNTLFYLLFLFLLKEGKHRKYKSKDLDFANQYTERM